MARFVCGSRSSEADDKTAGGEPKQRDSRFTAFEHESSQGSRAGAEAQMRGLRHPQLPTHEPQLGARYTACDQ
jgi:hypothetical protein